MDRPVQIRFPSADMKSPLPEVRATSSEEEERHKERETEKEPSIKHQMRMEKDSGYSDSSSESISSEETPLPTTVSTPDDIQPEAPAQAASTPIYILQTVVLKQPRIILVQTPHCRHRKRPSPESYLPILRSYPKIAPRIAAPPTSPPSSTSESPAPPMCKQAIPTLLEVSLRSLALLRRTRETQRSIRELRAHAILYQRALHGEEGGWERLQRAMERSGSYRNRPLLSDRDGISQAEESLASTVTTLDGTETSLDGTETSAGDTTLPLEEFLSSSEDGDIQTEEAMTSSGKSVMSQEVVTSEGGKEAEV